MDKHEYMNLINLTRYRCKDVEVDIFCCKINISDIIMTAWGDSNLSDVDFREVLAYTDGVFKELGERIKQEEKA